MSRGPALAADRIGGWWRVASLSATNRQLVGLLAVLLLGFSVPLGGELFSGASLRSMAFQMPEMGILALAMMVSLLSGGVDLSIIAIANLAALTMAYGMTATLPDIGAAGAIVWPIAAVVAGFAVALAVGLVNGVFIAYGRVSPILATLGTMSLVKGLALGLTHGDVISGFPPAVVFVGNGTIFGIPVPLFVLVLAALAVNLVLTRTPFGVRLTMMGTNAEAVRFSGIDTARVTMGIYAMSGLLAGLAGFIMLARFNSANAAYGESYLLVTILAAVLGGVDPFGGFGRVSGVILALVILQVISTAFNLLDLSQFLALAIWGATLIAVAGLKQMTVWVGRRRRGRRTNGSS
jgi:ribose/xylose/arabinose/galactoside ABC-type transport system permease subunit